MKSDLIQTVAPPPQEIAAPNATSNADLRNQAEQTSSSSALSRVTTNGTTETEKSSTLAAGSANIAATGSDSFGDAGVTSSQRIALSRSRLEAMMLEAQAASSSADAQRARAIARAVKMEAGAIRDVLRNAADTDAALAAAAAARAAEDAQIEAQRAVARAIAAADDRAGLAPWSSTSALRAAILAETAPLGTPTTNLHRSAFEALRRAQEILDLLARIESNDRANSAADGTPTVGGAALLNQIEAEDGALLDGWNLLA